MANSGELTVASALGSLFTPLRIRSVEVPNRFAMAPMTRYQSPGGVPDEAMAQYYLRRVVGETGLIITEGVGIDHPAALGGASGNDGGRRIPDLHGPALPGWQRVVDLVHGAGGTILAQLWHQGVNREAGTGPHPDAESTRPSGIWGLPGKTGSTTADALARMLPETRPLTDDEIVELIASYARSARNAVAAGFDGVEVHGAHGYLPDAFMWEVTNRRTDRWGGDARGRATFAAEVVRAIRREIGAERPLFYRFSQWKVQDYTAKTATSPAELEALLGPLADAGVDVFDASQRRFQLPEFPGSDLNLAGWAKKLTGKLTMTVGGVGLSNQMHESKKEGGAKAVNNLDALLERFERGEFDLVAVGRALLQDPAWTRKARLGLPFEGFDERSRSILT
jgi:2,4-dienoyl-CoA reductase-like NADH-dependent reductase (Old Yellow Enzyme family)